MNHFLTHHITNAKTNPNESVPIYCGIPYKDDVKRQLHENLYTQGSRALAVKIMMTSSKENIFRVTGPLWIDWWPVNGEWRWALMFYLMCVCTNGWTNGWTNGRDVGDFRQHCSHCDVTVMYCCSSLGTFRPQHQKVSFYSIKIYQRRPLLIVNNLTSSGTGTHLADRVRLHLEQCLFF